MKYRGKVVRLSSVAKCYIAFAGCMACTLTVLVRGGFKSCQKLGVAPPRPGLKSQSTMGSKTRGYSEVSALVKSEGSHKFALMKYLAGFSQPGHKSTFGNGAPTRSCTNLIILSEFDDVLEKLPNCNSQIEVKHVLNDFKIHKSAVTDLKAMAAAAKSRLQKAIVAAEKRMEQEKRRNQQESKIPPKKKVRKMETSGEDIFQHACEFLPITSRSTKADGTFVEANDLPRTDVPSVIRLPPDAEMFKEGSAINEAITRFTKRFGASPLQLTRLSIVFVSQKPRHLCQNNPPPHPHPPGGVVSDTPVF